MYLFSKQSLRFIQLVAQIVYPSVYCLIYGETDFLYISCSRLCLPDFHLLRLAAMAAHHCPRRCASPKTTTTIPQRSPPSGPPALYLWRPYRGGRNRWTDPPSSGTLHCWKFPSVLRENRLCLRLWWGLFTPLCKPVLSLCNPTLPSLHWQCVVKMVENCELYFSLLHLPTWML
jgi:hypothetical protein